MLLLPSEDQGTPDWLAARAGCATASEFSTVLAEGKTKGSPSVTRRKYMLQIVAERITGKVDAGYWNAAMRRGQLLEPEARIAYEMAGYANGNMLEQVGFRAHRSVEWCGASPDSLVGKEGMIEVKCPESRVVHLTTILSGKIPSEHVPQVQGNLWVLERKWCDFVSYHPDFPAHLQLCVYRVPRDDAYIAGLEAGVLVFLGEAHDIYNNLMKDYQPQ